MVITKDLSSGVKTQYRKEDLNILIFGITIFERSSRTSGSLLLIFQGRTTLLTF